jgi:hypothetical protein
LGGAYPNGCGRAAIDAPSPRSSNASWENRVTTQGLVAGRDTGGSAEAATREPISNRAGGTAAETAHAASSAATAGQRRGPLPVFAVTMPRTPVHGRCGPTGHPAGPAANFQAPQVVRIIRA